MRPDLTPGPLDPIRRGDHPGLDLLLLDRDGTVNERIDGDWVRTPQQLRLLPRAAAAVGRVTAAGIPVVIVTNQRGLATGAIRRDDWLAVCARLDELLATGGGRIETTAVCPHQRGRCDCRKPLPGLVHEVLAAAPWAEPGRCLLIGDADSDVAAASAADVPAILIGPEGEHADLWSAIASALGPEPDASP